MKILEFNQDIPEPESLLCSEKDAIICMLDFLENIVNTQAIQGFEQ